jgi:hypothetical protein
MINSHNGLLRGFNENKNILICSSRTIFLMVGSLYRSSQLNEVGMEVGVGVGVEKNLSLKIILHRQKKPHERLLQRFKTYI